MKKTKLFIFIPVIFLLAGCTDFLNIPPNQGGNDIIDELEDLDMLLNAPQHTRVYKADFMQAIYATDDCDMYSDLLKYETRDIHDMAYNVWNKTEFENIDIVIKSAWKSWQEIYDYNLILEKLIVLQGDNKLKKQLEGEALFYRAYTHFNLAVQFCMHPYLNGGNNPGIAYRDATDRNKLPENRNTISYTINRIKEDLDNAEKALTIAEKSEFEPDRKWRITLPTLYAFRARVELYLANQSQDYERAFNYAKQALEAYNILYNLATDNIFEKEIHGKTTLPRALSDMSYSFENEEYYLIHLGFNFSIILPPSKQLYDLYVPEDLRKSLFYDNDFNIAFSKVDPALSGTLISKSYVRYSENTYYKNAQQIGPSVMEMMLIMAECRARGFGAGDDAQTILRTLRQNRFPIDYIDAIGGTLADVKNERRRELPFVMRWYDLKRYNALDMDNIVINKKSYENIFDMNSDIVEYELAPNAAAYALPIPTTELRLLNWQQNDYDGVSIKKAN